MTNGGGGGTDLQLGISFGFSAVQTISRIDDEIWRVFLPNCHVKIIYKQLNEYNTKYFMLNLFSSLSQQFGK